MTSIPGAPREPRLNLHRPLLAALLFVSLPVWSQPAKRSRPSRGYSLGFSDEAMWSRITDRQGNLRPDGCDDEVRARAWEAEVPSTREFRRWDGVLLPLRPECGQNAKYRMLERAHAGLLVEDAIWEEHEGDGLRMWTGSFHPMSLLTWVELRKTTALTSTTRLQFRYLREASVESERDRWTVSVQQRIGRAHTAYVEVLPQFYKPETDVEACVAWRSTNGRLKLRAGIADLDAFSDYLFYLIRSRDDENTTGVIVDQRGSPKLAARARVDATAGPVSAELRVARVLSHTARVDVPEIATFLQTEDATYAAALVELRAGRWTTGTWGSAALTRIERESSTAAGRLEENALRAGGYAILQVNRLHLEGRGDVVLRPEDGSGTLRAGERRETESSLQADARVRTSDRISGLLGVVYDKWTVNDQDPLHLVDREATFTFVRMRLEGRFGDRVWVRAGANGGFPKLFEGGNVLVYSLW